MQQPPKTITLLLEAPLLAQGLSSAARKKIMSSRKEIDDMTQLWIKLLEEKAAAIKKLEEDKLYHEYRRECIRAKKEKKEQPKYVSYDRNKYYFDPRQYMSVFRKMDLIIKCFDEIRTDFKTSGEDLPWPECIPVGIRSCVPLRDYINAWVAEEEAAK